MTDSLPLRRGIVVLSAMVYWAGVWIQARRVRKKIGRSPNLKPRTPKEKLLWFGWFLVIAGWLGQPSLITGTGLPGFRISSQFLTPLGLIFGAALVLGGYACTLWCYQAMGNAWRIGINPREKNLLVTAGPYRAVRHPIYLFQIVMLAGALLLLPTVCSLALLLIHLACVLVKSSDEEAYLRGVHGKAYEEYVAHTGRLFPKW